MKRTLEDVYDISLYLKTVRNMLMFADEDILNKIYDRISFSEISTLGENEQREYRKYTTNEILKVIKMVLEDYNENYKDIIEKARKEHTVVSKQINL